MASCGSFEATGAYVTTLTTFVDCHAMALGREGYMALAASNSPVVIAIGGLITILIALFGYRLILNDEIRVRDSVFLVVKIGIVLALATQWSAYQAVVYDVVIQGPSELSLAVLQTNEVNIDNLPARVQQSFDALESLAHPHITAIGATDPASAAAPELPRIRLTTAEQGRLSASSVVLLLSSLAALLSVRVVAGIMLGLGPLFIACLLFRGSRGLFEGWVRVLAGAALGSVATTIVLQFEQAVLEPQLGHLLDSVAIQEMPATGAVEVFVTTLLFSVVLMAVLGAAVRVAAGFRLPTALARSLAPPVSDSPRQDGSRQQSQIPANDNRQQMTLSSRTQHAAPQLHTQDTSVPFVEPSRRIVMHDRPADVSAPKIEPLGQTHRPRLASRRSFSARRRDRLQ